MSHVATIDLRIQEHELDALASALDTLGCELRRDQTSYAWWGVSVGDYPLPEGVTKEQLGHCKHAIRVKGTHPVTGASGPWEIGLIPHPDGKGGYLPIYDFYGSAGHALHAKLGNQLTTMKVEFATEIAKRHLMRAGMRVTQQNVQKAGL